MDVNEQIAAYLQSQPEAKRRDLEALHALLQSLVPNGPLTYLDGKDATGKVVTNPNIGYGRQTRVYADGSTREFYQLGLSANTGGISLYVMGLKDKTLLADQFGPTLGKATVTGYCIKFKRLADVDLGVLTQALQSGLTT